MQAFEYNILDFEIVTVAELLQRRPDSAINIMAQLSRHLWAEWGADFQRYYNIQCPFGLLREFLLTHLEASDDTDLPNSNIGNPDQTNIGNPDQTNIGNPDQMKDESTLLHALQEAFKANASISHSLNHPVTFVVYDKTNDAFVGTASLQKDDMRVCMELGGLWLANVYVVPHWRDIGVGRAMCKHALDYARNVYGHDKETARVHLWTFTEELQDWYARKFGFRLVKIVPEARMNVSSIRVMCLEL